VRWALRNHPAGSSGFQFSGLQFSAERRVTPRGGARPRRLGIGDSELVRRLALLAILVPGMASRTHAQSGQMLVDASFNRTWDAIVDLFARRQIPLRRLDRDSGLIATESVPVSGTLATNWAACRDTAGASASPPGGAPPPLETPVPPTHARYEIEIQGDSTQSTIRATAYWTAPTPADCTSNGTWEAAFEKEVRKQVAVGMMPPR
jgi:hypothetical protein